MKNIAEKIKELRIKENLTQEEFAKRIFVSREAVSRWEQDRGMPDIENLKSISREFNISLDNLVNDEVITQLTIANKNDLAKIKKIQTWSLASIAICLIFIVVVGLLNIPNNANPLPSGDMNMPEGVLIGVYIDIKDDGNINIKSIIEDNAASNDVYFIAKPHSNDYVRQGIHDLVDVTNGDYNHFQLNAYLSKENVETSKYYTVYYNYQYEDYYKPHGYSLVEITTQPTYIDQYFAAPLLHLYCFRYIVYGVEMFPDIAKYSSFYLNVLAVESFTKMKISEFNEEKEELKTAEVKIGDYYHLDEKTYQVKLYYSANNATWHVSSYGTFMFGGKEAYNIEVTSQLLNDVGYIDEYPANTFILYREELE